MKLLAAIPIIRIFSVDKAKEFYLGFLGFSLEWEHRFEKDLPLYAEIKRSGLTLHLSEHHGDATPGSTTFVPIEDIDALHRELTTKSYPYARPGIEVAGWGRVLEVADPFGNRIRFCERAKN
ncbi:glyoxalase superfamily protein [Bordetella sp. BOR01]|uniref:glyoxalase superfamily protein n=1 Tax=Bordetella sp. BOR01 TaxID=2854779 RepID=UPI001C45EEBC|nr:glyoxalase superfamily protein [Bordetella sp. BOR01]MBV7484049.1 VOC family protein [Bordetella sp. BOR01]